MKKYIPLRDNRCFRLVYYRGKSIVSYLLITYILKNKYNFNRIGITTSKKIGNAVQRNRARRIIKVACQFCCDNIQSGYDIVFIARKKTINSNSNQISCIMKKQLEKLNCWKN